MRFFYSKCVSLYIFFIIFIVFFFLEINFFRDLTELYLTNCNFYSIPEWVFELNQLKRFSFSQNNLQYIPPEITALKNLVYVVELYLDIFNEKTKER